MYFQLSEEQQLILKIAKEFAINEVRPRIREIERTDCRPPDLVKRAGELGLRGIMIPKEWGGLGGGLLTQVLVMEEMAKEGYIAGSLVNNMMAIPLLKMGTEKQKEKYLPGLASGEIVMGFAFTEASAGSDLSSIQTTAVKDGNEWVLNGTKIFISLINSDAFLVAARTNETPPGGISAFIVERNSPGFSTGKLYRKLGMHGSDTAELYLRNCRVPAENMMGEENKGLRVVLSALDSARVNVAAMTLGFAEGAFERAVAYAKQRVQFGRPISQFQIIQQYAADMLAEIEVTKAFVYRVAAMADAGEPITCEAAIAKLWSSEMASRVTDKAIQICGGYGLIEDGDIERYYRDARMLRIGEGTSEIQKLVIARTIFPKEKKTK